MKKHTFTCTGALLAVLSGPVAALTAEELFERLSPSVFVVHTWDGQGKRLALGSGVVIGKEQVITNCHVLRQASGIVVSRGNVSYGAELEYPDPERDLCQLKVKELAAPAVPMTELSSVKVGQRVYAIGAPRGLELSLTEGIVSSLRGGDEENPHLIQTSAAISGGSSGGGLFDAQGRLIGITTFKVRGGEQLNFAVPVDWVREVAKRGKEALAKRKEVEEARAAAARAGSANASLGPIDPTLPREMPQAGDTWTYVARDLRFKPEDRSRKYVHTVRDATRGSIVEAVSLPQGNELSRHSFSADFNVVYRPGAEVLDAVPFLTAFHRLKPGEQISGIKIAGLTPLHGDMPYAFDSARVVGFEQVTVGAGTFEALKVEYSGRVSNNLVENSSVFRGYQSFRQIVWYSPKTKRAVKLHAEGPGFATAYELESYALR